MNEIYSHFASDILPPHPSQQHVPDPNIRNSTQSVRYWTQLSDWYTTLPHVILYTSFNDLVLRLNRTTLDDLRQVSRRMVEHNARVADQLRDDWKDILLKVARNSPNHPHWSQGTDDWCTSNARRQSVRNKLTGEEYNWEPITHTCVTRHHSGMQWITDTRWQCYHLTIGNAPLKPYLIQCITNGDLKSSNSVKSPSLIS